MTPGELRELGLLLFCSPWPEPVPLVLRRFLSLGAMARTDATPFVFNQLQRKPWVSRGNGFMQLSGLSAPSSQDSRVRAKAAFRCSAFLVISRHPNAGAVPSWSPAPAKQQPYTGRMVPTCEAEDALSPACGEDTASSHQQLR